MYYPVCYGTVCSVLVILFCNGASAHAFNSTSLIYRLLRLFIVYIVFLSFSSMCVYCMIAAI